MRRLPVYMLLDTSGSIQGEPIEAVKVGLQNLISVLRQDPFALESVHISLITFDRDVKNILPMTDLQSLQLPDIVTPESGPTHLGAALEMLCDCYDREVIKTSEFQKGDWMPLLFIMTDGSPSDIQKYRDIIPVVKKKKFANIIACAAGPKAKDSYLKELTDAVVHLDSMDRHTFSQFFKWVSDAVSSGNKSMGTTVQDTSSMLPPPPPEVHVVI